MFFDIAAVAAEPTIVLKNVGGSGWRMKDVVDTFGINLTTETWTNIE